MEEWNNGFQKMHFYPIFQHSIIPALQKFCLNLLKN
jgi:hypothetical protein